MMSDTLRQMKECPDGVEGDGFDHKVERNVQRSMLNVERNRSGGQVHLFVRLIHMLPVEHNDPINAKILAISEDKIEGFVREPFEEIARRSGVDVDVVMVRIAAMLRAGTIRRVRQTLLATNLADAALDRRSHRRLGLQTLDDVESAAWIFAAATCRVARKKSWRRTFSYHAGQRDLHARCGPCSPQND